MYTTICKVTMCDDTTISDPRTRNPTMTPQSHNWLSADVQARTKPPPITIIKAELEEECASNIIKVNMGRKPALATSEKYELKMSTFENIQPEEFLTILKKSISQSMEQGLRQFLDGLIIYVRYFISRL